MRAFIVLVVLVVLAAIGIGVKKKGERAERARLAAVTGTWEYQYPPVVTDVTSTLTIRPNGTWIREYDSRDTAGRSRISHDSGTYGLTGVNLILRSTIELPASLSYYTVSGDTIFTRTAEQAARLEQLSGKRIGATEGMFVRTGR